MEMPCLTLLINRQVVRGGRRVLLNKILNKGVNEESDRVPLSSANLRKLSIQIAVNSGL